jgi:hypothetical protein
MSQIREIIADRIQKLEDSLVPLRQEVVAAQAKIAKIETELLDLRNAAKAIGMANRLRQTQLGVTRRTQARVTIKEAVLQILAEHPAGLIALDLLAMINQRFDWKLVRPSLSPQLTRLKREGKILNQGSTWRLAGHPDLFLPQDTNTK